MKSLQCICWRMPHPHEHRLVEPSYILKLPGTVLQQVNTASTLKATLIQLNDNNAELIQLAKEQCNTNDAVRNENTDLIQQVATLRDEANYNETMKDRLDRLSSDVTSLQPTHQKGSFAAVASYNQRSVLMFGDQMLRHIHTVTTADNKEVAMHWTTRVTVNTF